MNREKELLMDLIIHYEEQIKDLREKIKETEAKLNGLGRDL